MPRMSRNSKDSLLYVPRLSRAPPSLCPWAAGATTFALLSHVNTYSWAVTIPHPPLHHHRHHPASPQPELTAEVPTLAGQQGGSQVRGQRLEADRRQLQLLRTDLQKKKRTKSLSVFSFQTLLDRHHSSGIVFTVVLLTNKYYSILSSCI